MPADECLVYPAITPENGEWLWRWYIDEDDPNDCAFDLTASSEILGEYLASLPDDLRNRLHTIPWSQLFDVDELPDLG